MSINVKTLSKEQVNILIDNLNEERIKAVIFNSEDKTKADVRDEVIRQIKQYLKGQIQLTQYDTPTLALIFDKLTVEGILKDNNINATPEEVNQVIRHELSKSVRQTIALLVEHKKDDSTVNLRNYNVFYSNNTKTVDLADYSNLDSDFIVKRKHNYVLSSRDTIRLGLLNCSFFDLVNLVITRNISDNYNMLVLVLDNLPHILEIIKEVLTRIPERSRLRNNGFLKDHMFINRFAIREDIEDLISSTFIYVSSEEKASLRPLLVSLLELLLLKEFAKHGLIDNAELSLSVMTYISDFTVEAGQWRNFVKYVLSSQLSGFMNDITSYSSFLSSKLSEDSVAPDRVRGVDFSSIVGAIKVELLKVRDSIQSVQNLEHNIVSFFRILRVIRDRHLFAKLPRYTSVVTVCEELYQGSKDAIDTLLSTYDINVWLDNISFKNIESLINDIVNISIQKDKYFSVAQMIMATIKRQNSLYRLMDKDEFMSYFTFKKNRSEISDSINFVYMHRNFADRNTPTVMEALIQKERMLARSSFAIAEDSIANIFVNKDFSDVYSHMVSLSHSMVADVVQTSYLSTITKYLPQGINGTIFQLAMLHEDDLVKIAHLNCEVLYYVWGYCPELIKEPELESTYASVLGVTSFIKSLNDNNEKRIALKAPIFVLDKKYMKSSADYFNMKSAIKEEKVLTRSVLRTLYCIEDFVGSKAINIQSDMIKSDRSYISSFIMRDQVHSNLHILDTLNVYTINCKQSSLLDKDHRLVVDMKRLINPKSLKTFNFSHHHFYYDIVDAYNKVLLVFRDHILSLAFAKDEIFSLMQTDPDLVLGKKPLTSIGSQSIFSNEDIDITIISTLIKKISKLNLNDSIFWLLGSYSLLDIEEYYANKALLEDANDDSYSKPDNANLRVHSFKSQLPREFDVNEYINNRFKELRDVKTGKNGTRLHDLFYYSVSSAYKNSTILRKLVQSTKIADSKNNIYSDLESILSILELYGSKLDIEQATAHYTFISLFYIILFNKLSSIVGDSRLHLNKKDNIFSASGTLIDFMQIMSFDLESNSINYELFASYLTKFEKMIILNDLRFFRINEISANDKLIEHDTTNADVTELSSTHPKIGKQKNSGIENRIEENSIKNI